MINDIFFSCSYPNIEPENSTAARGPILSVQKKAKKPPKTQIKKTPEPFVSAH